MSAPQRGWCPSAHAPMPTGDGLLSRVREPVLSADAARRLADAARRHGNGAIDLTNRGNWQVRGLTDASARAFAAEMVTAGLVAADPAVERLRLIVTSPLAGIDPACAPGTADHAGALAAALAAEAEFAALPDKFGFIVDGGGQLPLDDVPGDIRLIGSRRGWFVQAEGADLMACDIEPVPLALALARTFLRLRPDPSIRRMRQLIAALGADAVFAEAGLTPEPLPRRRGNGTAPIGLIRCWPPRLTGCHGVATTSEPAIPPESWRGAVGIGAPFGGTDAAGLIALANFAESYGDGTLRLTPWRAVLLPVTDRRKAEALLAGAASAGFITDADDPRRRIRACPGRPACASASVDTRADAAALAGTGFSGTLHVSGCAKGCASPEPADWVLVGDGGCYGLIRNGKAGDIPERTGATAAAALGIG